MAKHKFDDIGAGLFTNKSLEDAERQYNKSKAGRKENQEKYMQMSCYLTDKQKKAIIIRTAEGDLDKSGVIRAALDLYLKDYLEKL